MSGPFFIIALCAAFLMTKIASAQVPISSSSSASSPASYEVTSADRGCSTSQTATTGISEPRSAMRCLAGLIPAAPLATAIERPFNSPIHRDILTFSNHDTRVVKNAINAAVGGSVSVLDYGADPTGASDSSSAFTAALSANNSVFVPCGTYLVSITISINNFTLNGAGQCAVLKPFDTAKPVIIISGSNFSIISSLFFAESTGTSDGLRLVGATSNLLVEDVIFYTFSNGSGLNCAMTAGAAGSGLYIRGGYSVLNAVGYKLTYCHDFKIDGAQAGSNSGPGIQLDHSDAGIVANTFAWENGRAIDATASNYDYVLGSRLTQSASEGIRWNGGSYLNFSNNQFYQNSSATTGAVPDIALVGVNSANVTSNNFFDWTGVAHVNYSATVDATSIRVNITGNNFSPYTTLGSTSIASGATSITLARNTPNSTARNNWSPIANVPVITPSAGVGGTASTIYLAPFSSSSEQGSPSPVSGLFGCFYIFSNASPASGETWTYTARIAGANTSLVATQTSGQVQTSVCSATAAPAIIANQAIDIKVTTNGSTNLGAVFFRGSIAIYE